MARTSSCPASCLFNISSNSLVLLSSAPFLNARLPSSLCADWCDPFAKPATAGCCPPPLEPGSEGLSFPADVTAEAACLCACVCGRRFLASCASIDMQTTHRLNRGRRPHSNAIAPAWTADAAHQAHSMDSNTFRHTLARWARRRSSASSTYNRSHSTRLTYTKWNTPTHHMTFPSKFRCKGCGGRSDTDAFQRMRAKICTKTRRQAGSITRWHSSS